MNFSALHADPFAVLKARYCLAALALSWVLPILPAYFGVAATWTRPAQEQFDRYAGYAGDALLAAFLLGVAWASHGSVRFVLGRAPRRSDLLPIGVTVLLTYCVSGAIDNLVMGPLSYLAPGFTEWWLKWTYQPIIYVAADGSLRAVANALQFVSLVVATPILEELIFRGYLLHRWSKKWGLRTGVLVSSAAFGAIHPDNIQAMLTGIGFALLYLKTRSLWAPVLAHALYNLVVWTWSLCEVLLTGREHGASVADLREGWGLGIFELLIVVVVADRILRRKTPLGPFALPSNGHAG